MDWPSGCPFADEFKDSKCYLYKYGPCKKTDSLPAPCVVANFEPKNVKPTFDHGAKKHADD